MSIQHHCRLSRHLAPTFLLLAFFILSASVFAGNETAASDRSPKSTKTSKSDPTIITLDPCDKPDTEKYTLRYRFEPNEDVRWKVERRQRVEMSQGGKNQSTDSVTGSTMRWHVLEVASDGTTTFESTVDDVDMYQKMSDHDPVRYNSKKDKTPPPGFVDAAKRVGRPFAQAKLNSQGITLERTPLLKEPAQAELPQLTFPLPTEPVAVGQSWRQQRDIRVPLENGMVKTILRETVYTLKSVKTGVATIEWTNEILTPLHSPEIEFKLITHYTHGTIRFDVDAGRILSQQTDLDHQVIGFQGGDSCFHQVSRSVEELLPPLKKTVPSQDTSKEAIKKQPVSN